jgi:hypothetical protein
VNVEGRFLEAIGAKFRKFPVIALNNLTMGAGDFPNRRFDAKVRYSGKIKRAKK